jgi:hypothetical protein
MTKERTMRYTIAVTYIITTTGNRTVEATSPEAAQEQVEAALEKAWRHDPYDWQAEIDLLDDAQTEHEIPHSPGSSGRRSASEGEDHSHPDFPLIHDVPSSCQPQYNVNNIKALEFYHEIRWSLVELSP